MANIIFDFDGTIADTFGLIVDVSYELTGAERLPEAELEQLRKLPILTAIRRLGGSPWQIPKLMLKTRGHMSARIDKVKPFVGLPEVLKQLHAQGHQLYIMSSNTHDNLTIFLKAHDLESTFAGTYTVFFGSSWLKAYRLHEITNELHLRPSECYYVGNEALDVRAAKWAGMRAVAVTWSGQDKKVLRASTPTAVAKQPADLLTMFTN